MKQTLKKLPYEQLKIGQNVRLSNDGSDLVLSLLDDGLNTPIMVDETGEIKRGYRRHNAIGQIKQTYPNRFKELFGDGVPVVVITGATPLELALLHVDHGQNKALTDDFEIQLCANMLFAADATEAAVANHMCTLLDTMYPIPAERRRELDAIREKEGESAYFKKYAEYRRGVIQDRKSAFCCPEVVMKSLEYKARGTVPEGFKAEQLDPKITYAQVRGLKKKFDTDLAVLEGGISKYTKINPGPSFKAAWKEHLEKAQKKASEANTTVRQKAMSATDMLKSAENMASDTLRALTAKHAGRDVSIDLVEADRNVYYMELVRKHSPNVWAGFVKEAKAIEAELRDAAEAK